MVEGNLVYLRRNPWSYQQVAFRHFYDTLNLEFSILQYLIFNYPVNKGIFTLCQFCPICAQYIQYNEKPPIRPCWTSSLIVTYDTLNTDYSNLRQLTCTCTFSQVYTLFYMCPNLELHASGAFWKWEATPNALLNRDPYPKYTKSGIQVFTVITMYTSNQWWSTHLKLLCSTCVQTLTLISLFF